MQTGIIKLWNKDRGFGFIETESGDEHFMHITALADLFQPEKGMRVAFEVGISERINKECAILVRKI